MAAKPKTEKKPVYLVWGADEYEVTQKSRELVDSLCPPSEHAFGLESVDGRVDTIELAVAALNKCLSAIRTVGFFGAGKTIWLRDVKFFVPKSASQSESSGGDGDEQEGGGLSEEVKERIAALVDEIKKGLPDGQHLVINTDKINRGSALFKAVQAAGEIIEFNPPEKDYQAVEASEEYAENAFREAGLSLRPGVLDEFLERTGRDSRQIRNEIDKLFLFLGDRKEVRSEDVRAIVSATREAAVWDLTDAVGRRDMPGALAVLRHLFSQKEAPQLMISLLEGRIRDLLVFRQCIDRRWLRVNSRGNRVFTEWSPAPDADAVLSALPKDPRKMHWFPAGKSAEQAMKYSFEELLRAHRLTTAAHERLVSSPVPAEIVLEHLLITVMSRGGNRVVA
jgi:DNA polymerase-3 subunit delta